MNKAAILDFFISPTEFINQANGSVWTYFLQQAREQGLTARYYFTLQKLNLLEAVPCQIKFHGESAAHYAAKQQHSLYYELSLLEPLFKSAKFPCLLLKGAAYRVQSLPFSYGRLFSDIDLLVPYQHLKQVRDQLFFYGFYEGNLSDYDRQYYLRWSHQNPPLYHIDRSTVLDLHHHIYPTASAMNINVQPMFDHAEMLPGSAFKVPKVAHLFIHAAVHLFYQEETHKLVKDIIDLNELLDHVATQKQFEFLLRQSTEMNVESAVSNACYVLAKIFDNQNARQLLQQVNKAPQHFICTLLTQMLKPTSIFAGFAKPLWFFRGHFLKMRWQILMYHAIAKPISIFKTNFKK